VDTGTLGQAALLRGDGAVALRLAQEALEIFRSIGYRTGEGDMLYQAGRAALRMGDRAAARSYLSASVAIRRELGNEAEVAVAEAALAEAAD